ncbi:MAG: hypothetical protein HKL91_08365 [Candidatus Eremiobacteraeota bacterium]|uniref:Uncharacterized protein n=1 Tax=mine drainage metagenome TaxID=410659 RepID=E6PI91_9ZZZZ|nr:hypothetical protein [Candidatus Eremiobacteraeota bacterium]
MERRATARIRRIGVAIALMALLPVAVLASTASTVVTWRTNAIVKMTLTPNYNSGFGAVPAVIGAQPAPTHGPNAVLDGGSVDFGNIEAGKTYLYKYAVEINVTTNSATGFNIYGEGAADFYNLTDGTSVPISQAVYYLNSTANSDPNTGFSAGAPFMKTSGSVTGGGYATPPTISYIAYPSPIAQSLSANGTYYYDYELKPPNSATNGQYYVWIVYTVVAK